MISAAVVIKALRGKSKSFFVGQQTEFSRWQINDIFPRKQDLTFHANCLCWIGGNLHEMSNPILREKYCIMSSADGFTQSTKH